MKKFLTLLLALALGASLSVPALAAGFSDVPASSPFAAAIGWAVERGITNGTTPTTFGPGNTCTTSHILTFLWRANGRPGDGGDERAAVSAWAKGIGIDVPDLSAPCTRAAAVTYLWKAAGSPAPGRAASFTDVPAGAEYASAVSWAVEKGVTNGTGGGAFSPESVCTRGQIVTFLHRAMEGAAAPQTPEEPEAPVQPEDKSTTIAVSSSLIGDDTVWTISDNGWETGYLNNGEPITEDNVITLIKECQSKFPQGMSWADSHEVTNTFNTKNAVQTLKIEAATRNSTYGGCGGFAALVNNYVFGQTNNPIRKLSDNSQARPGDYVLMKNPSTGVVQHAFILTGYNANGNLTYADGGGFASQGTGIINWSAGAVMLKGLVQGNSTTTYEVWTRYPD